MSKTHTDLNAYRIAKRLARQERDICAAKVEQRWAEIQDPTTRGVLLRDAAGDALRGWKPYRRLHDLVQGRIPASTVGSMGMALAASRMALPKRIVLSAATVLASKLMGRNDERPLELRDIARSIGNVVRGMRERKALREAQKAAASGLVEPVPTEHGR